MRNALAANVTPRRCVAIYASIVRIGQRVRRKPIAHGVASMRHFTSTMSMAGGTPTKL
jgi:hypothetical protein